MANPQRRKTVSVTVKAEMMRTLETCITSISWPVTIKPIMEQPFRRATERTEVSWPSLRAVQKATETC